MSAAVPTLPRRPAQRQPRHDLAVSSRGSLPHADLDVAFLHDPKVRRLRLRLPDAEYAIAVVVYLATLLESWRERRRLTVEEAVPPVPYEDAVPHLQAVGLLDAESRVPAHAYEAWTASAEARREAGRANAVKRWSKPRNRAPKDATALQRHNDGNASQSVRQSEPELTGAVQGSAADPGSGAGSATLKDKVGITVTRDGTIRPLS